MYCLCISPELGEKQRSYYGVIRAQTSHKTMILKVVKHVRTETTETDTYSDDNQCCGIIW